MSQCAKSKVKIKFPINTKAALDKNRWPTVLRGSADERQAWKDEVMKETVGEVEEAHVSLGVVYRKGPIDFKTMKFKPQDPNFYPALNMAGFGFGSGGAMPEGDRPNCSECKSKATKLTFRWGGDTFNP